MTLSHRYPSGEGLLYTELPVDKSLALLLQHCTEWTPCPFSQHCIEQKWSHPWGWGCWPRCRARSGWVSTPGSAAGPPGSPARTWPSWLGSQWHQRQTGTGRCWAQSPSGSCSCHNRRRQHQTCKERVEVGLREIPLGTQDEFPPGKWHCLPHHARTQRDPPQDWGPEQADVGVIPWHGFVCCHPCEGLAEMERKK